MIRPLTFVCLLSAGMAGLFLYQAKHRSALLDREIAQTLKAIDDVHARTGVLRAEWALVTERDRLSELAQRFLNLRPLAPSQFVAYADVASRLPAPAPTIEPGAPATDQPMEPSVSEPEPAPAATVASAIPAPAPSVAPAAHPAAVAMVKPPVARADARPAVHTGPALPARPNLVAVTQAVTPAASPIVPTISPSVGGSLLGAAAPPVGTSALGGFRTALPAPVPIVATAAGKPNYWTGH
jgi:hypothetical protein